MQGEETWERLLEAGMRVLAERGYHASRVDDVVEAAQLSHGTFYLYFANKDDMVRVLAARCAEEMAELAEVLPEVAPSEAGRADLRAWLADFYACYRRYGVVIRAWMEDQRSSRELTPLGVKTFARMTNSLADRMTAAPAAGRAVRELRAVALLGMIERFCYFVTSRSLAGDDEAVDALAVMVHRSLFATPSP